MIMYNITQWHFPVQKNPIRIYNIIYNTYKYQKLSNTISFLKWTKSY